MTEPEKQYGCNHDGCTWKGSEPVFDGEWSFCPEHPPVYPHLSWQESAEYPHDHIAEIEPENPIY